MKLAADASALVAESLRLRGALLVAHTDLELYIAEATWSEVTHEVGRRVDSMVQRGRFHAAQRGRVYQDTIALLAQNLTVVPETEYAAHESEARERIPRDPNDWPTVAVALAQDVGIWTIDEDFFGCGVPVWTTQTLLTHLANGRA